MLHAIEAGGGRFRGLAQIAPGHDYPIYISHTKPSETDTIMREILQLGDQRRADGHAPHDIRWLSDGHVFEL